MANIDRNRTQKETLDILPCPFCAGDIVVSDCGYSSFNPGNAECRGTCKRKFKLGMVNDQWDAGLRWNKLQPVAREIEDCETKLSNLRRFV